MGASLHLHHLIHFTLSEFCLLNNRQNCKKVLNQYFQNMDAESFSMTALSKHYGSLGCMLHLQAKAVLD